MLDSTTLTVASGFHHFLTSPEKSEEVGKGVKTTSHSQGYEIQQFHFWFEKTLALCHCRENDFPRGQVFTEMTKCKCFLEPGMGFLEIQHFHSWFEKTLALCHSEF